MIIDRTSAAARLANMDARRAEIEASFDETYRNQPRTFRRYRRAFFRTCEELLAFDSGLEWLASHCRFRSA